MKHVKYSKLSALSLIALLIIFLLSGCQSEQKINGGNPLLPDGNNTLSIISPNGGELIVAGTTFEISWTGDVTGTIILEYSVDSGQTWKTIVADYPNSGSYDWDPVPNDVSNGCFVRISTTDGSVTDQSNRGFGIVSSTTKMLNISSPNGGEELFVGQSFSIAWNSTGIQNIKIEYSSNNGAAWILIASSFPASSSSYLWSPVPNFPSEQCLVRLTDTTTDTVSAVSGTTFTITANRLLTITSPNGGETWAAGTPQDITWSSDHISFVKIEYSTNNGDSWMVITENTSSDGLYSWTTVPNNPTTSARIRITDAVNGSPEDISDAAFSITGEQGLTILTPNGGENWPVGSSQIITWTSSNPKAKPIIGDGKYFTKNRSDMYLSPNKVTEGVTDVMLEYSTDAGATWFTVIESTPNNGSYVWATLPNVNSSLCRIKISDAADGLPSDISDDNFSIANSSVEEIIVTSPNGGEQWEAGTKENITWNSTSVSNVKIEYTINNGVDWTTIVESTPSDGFYSWDPIPNNPSTNSRIRISNVVGGFPTDLSDNFFSITPESNITVLSPNGGETIQAGSSQSVTWSSVNIENVKIEFSTNGGATWNLITGSTPSDGHFTWEPVPAVSSTICRIKVSDALDGSPADLSDGNFAITNQTIQIMEVTSPNGGEEFLAGTTQNITWYSSGIASVDIEFTTDNGLTWSTIVTGAAGSGSYEWSPIPDINSTQCKVRVKDNEDGSPSDESNSVFTIHPIQNLTVISPNGGEVFVAGDPVNITWNTQGVENVKIEFTVNNGILEEDWFTLVESTPSDGSYQTGFSIPSEQYRIRISDADDGSPMDQSDGTFTVLDQPQISVISPNGGEYWLVGETYEINWQSNNVQDVKIEYTTNGGFSWSIIIASTPSDGIYENWTPSASDTSSNCLVRISDAADGAPSDVSDNFFTIHGANRHLSFVFPNGGEHIDQVWGADTVIVWTTNNVANVGIDYSLDNGVTWINITPNYPSTGAYRWLLPPRSVVSSLTRLRVYDASDPSFSDMNDAPFYLNMFPPGLKMTNFGNGGRIKAGSNKPIKWIGSDDIRKVNIYYSNDGGSNWTKVANNVTSINNRESVFNWTVPGTSSSNCIIKITDADGRYTTISNRFVVER
jgi:hypothetical protein